MPDLTDTYANAEGQFVFNTDDTTPQQVVNALEDFTTWLDLFEVRSREYGQGSFFFLGSKGQFSDIYRKIIKLKTALWDGKPEQLTSEGVEEVIYDLIGHLFLTLQCLRHERGPQDMAFRGSEEAPDMDGTAKERLGKVLRHSSAFSRLADADEKTSQRIHLEVQAEKTKQRVESKREQVLELYPQISLGSLQARQEESLDWLISSAKPIPAKGMVEKGEKPDHRNWIFQEGDRVMSNTEGYVKDRVGTILRRRTEDAGTWYAVDFGEKAHSLTCSQASLVWAPVIGTVETQLGSMLGSIDAVASRMTLAPRKIRDNPQA